MRQINQLAVVVATLLAAVPVFGQNAISVRAGMVNVADGEVTLAGKAVEPKGSEIVQIAAGDLLKTGEGRAEVLLTPGAFLRMPDQSAFTLDQTALEDVHLTLSEGSALIEVAELLESNAITVKLHDAEFRIVKAGLYRFSFEPANVKVFDGELLVSTSAGEQRLKKSRQLTASNGMWQAGKFDTDDTDALFRWSRRRSEYVAMANRSSARVASSFAGAWGGRTSGWLYNPYFGTFTFIPMFGNIGSPFGYSYYTPFTIYRAYQPPQQPIYSGGGGGYGGGIRGAGASTSPRTAESSFGSFRGDSKGSAGIVSTGSPSGGGSGVISVGPSSGGGGGGSARGGGKQ